jgi:type III secretion protein HrpB1
MRVSSESVISLTAGEPRNPTTPCDITMMNALSSVRRSPYQQCNDKIVSALLQLFAAGMVSASSDDLEDLLLALQVLRPSLKSVDFSEANLRVRQADWIGALRVLKAMEARHQSNAACFALIACCLYQLRDREWQGYAEQVLEDGNRAALSVVSAFLKLNKQISGAIELDKDAEHILQQVEYALANGTA